MKNNKGFAPIVLVIAIVAAIAGVSVYFVLNRQVPSPETKLIPNPVDNPSLTPTLSSKSTLTSVSSPTPPPSPLTSNLSFTFTNPVAGQTVQQGSNVVITWSKTGTWSSSVNYAHRLIQFDLIRISDGVTVGVRNYGNFSAGSYTWNVPVGSDAPPPGQYKLRAGTYVSTACPAVGYPCPTPKADYIAESGVFTIVGTIANPQPTITFLQPQGGEVAKVGTNFTIRWNSTNVSAGALMYLALIPTTSNSAFASNEFGEIVSAASVSGTYSWFIFKDIIVHTDIAGAMGYAVGKDKSRVINTLPAGSYKIRATLVNSGNIITSADSATFTLSQ